MARAAKKRRIAILTGGGDCPGLNAVIRAVVSRAVVTHEMEVVGILNGWDGLMDGHVRPLGRDDVRGILQRGGTILGTSRRDPYVHGDGYASVRRTVEANGIDAVIVIGGDGTLRTALALQREGLAVIGVPKTIDNDIAGTDLTFGFDTAVSIATEALDRISTTAESHNRIMVVEVMGRTKGWIATYAAPRSRSSRLCVKWNRPGRVITSDPPWFNRDGGIGSAGPEALPYVMNHPRGRRDFMLDSADVFPTLS